MSISKYTVNENGNYVSEFKTVGSLYMIDPLIILVIGVILLQLAIDTIQIGWISSIARTLCVILIYLSYFMSKYNYR